MAQYVDRMTQFKNAITNVTKAMTGSKCTPFIDFYVGDLKMSTYNKRNVDYFMQMDMEYAGTGVGSANKFTISIAYVPQPNQDPNAIDRALDGVTATQQPCRLRYGYGGVDGFNLVSQEYECIILGYSISLRDSIIYYTINGVSTAMTLREKRYNFPPIVNGNPLLAVRNLFNMEDTFIVKNLVKDDALGNKGISYFQDYDIELIDNCDSYANNMDMDAVSDVTVYEYLDTLLMNIDDKEDPTAQYWYSVSDIKGKKTINIHRTSVISNGRLNRKAIIFTFDWGGNHKDNSTNNLVKAFETEFKGELNIATSENIMETRYGIDSSGKDVSIEGMEELEVGDYMEQDNRVTTREWSKPMDWAYNASIELEGIPADIPIGAIISVNPMFYGQKHHTAGLYMVIGGRSNITSGGFTTNLSLFKIIVDDTSSRYLRIKRAIVKAITGAVNLITERVKQEAESSKTRIETTFTYSGKDIPYTPTYNPPATETQTKKQPNTKTSMAKKVYREITGNAPPTPYEKDDVYDPTYLKNLYR